MRFRFSDCELDDQAFVLMRDGVAVSIEPKVIDLLLVLVQNPDVLMSKDMLIDIVWDGRIVSDSAIAACVSAARKAVGDDGKAQAIIRTVPRRGVMFVGAVERDGPKPVQASATPLQDATPIIKYATADDGTKIAYSVSGSGPPLLRVAHFPSHLELEWSEPTERTFFDALIPHHTLIRMDFRGSGLSDMDVTDFSDERMARDIGVVADAIGLDRFALLGASSGSGPAIQFAAESPERVSHLVLLGGYVEGRSARHSSERAHGDDVFLRMIESGWSTPGSQFISGYLSVYFPDVPPELLDLLARNIQQSTTLENEIAMRQLINNRSFADVLDAVQTPTLVMHARDDAAHPLEQGQKLAKGIADAQLIVLESRNHYPVPGEDSWQVHVDAMLAFLAR